MGWHDPFPGVEFLSAVEVRTLFRFGRAREFNAWVATQPAFPRPVVMGKTPGGKPRQMWAKGKVLAFIDLFGSSLAQDKP